MTSFGQEMPESCCDTRQRTAKQNGDGQVFTEL